MFLLSNLRKISVPTLGNDAISLLFRRKFMFMDHTRSAAFQINLKNAKSPSKISSVSTYSENRDIITAYHRLGKDL